MKITSVLKKLLLTFIVLAFLFAVFLTTQDDPKGTLKLLNKMYGFGLLKKNCKAPLIYSISDIDSRFKVSKSEALKIAQQAEKIWENAINVNLFEYQADSDKDIMIDFIFGKEQERTIAETASGKTIDANWENYDAVLKKYNSLGATYEARVTEYNTQSKKNDADVVKFNQRIADWKKRPGNDAEYDSMKNEEERLRKNQTILKTELANLQNISTALKTQKTELDALWAKYSAVAEAHDKVYATGEIVEQAVFDGMFRIKVYTYENADYLRRILTHEMGHALGIDHLTQKQSIMYYLQNPEQNVKNLALSQEDIGALKELCKID